MPKKLVYDSDGNNSESLGESGPRRVHRNDPHEESIAHVDSDADRLGN